MRKVKIIATILILALFFNVLFFFTLTVNGYDLIYNIAKDYTTENMNIFDDDYSEYDFLEKPLKKVSIFYADENSGIKVNYEMFYNNLRYCSKYYKVKYIVTDLSYAESLWLNYYMSEDNAHELIKNQLETSATLHHSSQDLLDLLLNIMTLNDSLDDKEKMEIVGINAEKSTKLTTEYINYIFEQFSNKRKPSEIYNVYNFNAENELDYYQNMYNSLISNERIYKEYFVDKYFMFYMLLRNYFTAYGNVDIAQICVTNFMDINTNNIRMNYYVQLPEELNFYETLIENHPNYSDEMFNMKYVYDNCRSIYGQNISQYPFNLYKTNEPQVFLLDNSILKYFEKYRRFVYKINNKNYNSYNTEFGDKYIIFSNSPPMTLLEVPIDTN